MIFLESNAPLLVIIGPSGSGKSSVVQELSNRCVVEVTPSWTTRPARKGELNSAVEHKFVTEKEFERQVYNSLFLEVVKPFNLPYSYGMPRVKQPALNCVPVVMIRANLLKLLYRHYSNLVVYQIEDTFSRVEDRLRKRQKYGEEQGSRLDDYEKEVDLGRKLARSIFLMLLLNIIINPSSSFNITKLFIYLMLIA